MLSNALSLPQANLKLALWNVEANSIPDSDLYVWISNSGIPDDIAIRLYELIQHTKKIGNKVISIGKIILIKIVEFIKEHPHLSIGVALGIIIGLLVNSIPFIGPILSPLAFVLGITVGAIAGHRLDKRAKNSQLYDTDSIIGSAEEVLEIVKEFFQLMVEVFNLVLTEVRS